MALVLIILLRIFFLLVTQGSLVDDSTSYKILLNSTLTPHKNPAWFSPSGLFAFGFYPQDGGYAVGIWLTTKPEITVVWTAYRDELPLSSNSTFELTRDGWLLLLTNGKEDYMDSQFFQATSASMHDSGNFVLYDHSEVIWQSFDYPSDTILGGQTLVAGDSLCSSVSASRHSCGRFVLYMQDDGNLVAYTQNSSWSSDNSYWSTATYSTYYESLKLSRSGSLYMVGFDAPRKILNPNMSSPVRNNETIIYRATLNPQGNFVLYSHIFTTPPSNLNTMNVEWTALSNPCKAKGSCGDNSYCNLTGNPDNMECQCFPGFSFLNDTIDGKILGCHRDFTDEEACSQRGLEFSYNISVLENMELETLDPYSVMNLSKNVCSKSCLDDCNCWASLYADESCKKLKDPIVNALLDKSIHATMFIKIRVPQTTSRNITKLSVAVERKTLIRVLAIAFGSLALVCTLMAFSSFFFYRVHAHRYERVPENVGFGFISDHLILRSFSFDELQKATDGFKEVIGGNTNGKVYKGFIFEGKKAVAVKKLEKVIEGGEFRAEITAIAQTHHRNLVRLLGFCIHRATKLLVYEFMSNGSLADLLVTRPGWKQRVKVALDVARGILYLHQECETRIIHCNIKPHNILFDESWTAKISDFGLSKPLSPNQSGTLTSVRGTRGYLAPEWFRNTLISTKVDTYSFGVVLLEILCCTSEMKINVSSEDKTALKTWVYSCFAANELNRLIGDADDDDEEEGVGIYMFEKMVKVGLLCVQDNPEARPSIRDVILMLEGTTDIPLPPSPVPIVVF